MLLDKISKGWVLLYYSSLTASGVDRSIAFFLTFHRILERDPAQFPLESGSIVDVSSDPGLSSVSFQAGKI